MVKNTVQCLRAQSQRGVTLIELLVASAIFGAIGVIFINALATGQNEAYRVERMSEAESVARSQIELIKSLPYSDDDSYPLVTDTGDKYTAGIEVIDVSPVEYPNTMQKIIVDVNLNGNTLLSLETLKVKR
jgi:prepilin-type N-terminal cleavage/methylation domain-containing protein